MFLIFGFFLDLLVDLGNQVFSDVLYFNLGALKLFERISFVQNFRFFKELVLLELLEVFFDDVLVFVLGTKRLKLSLAADDLV